MSKSYGLGFKLVNDVKQRLSKNAPGWEHWATIQRGLDEYILFHCSPPPGTKLQASGYAGRTYIEKIERDRATIVFKQIKDDHEFEDISAFCQAAGLLTKDHNTEIKVGYWEDDQVKNYKKPMA